MSSTPSSEALLQLSTLIGWGYFLAWSASFWPQTIINYRRKSVSGLSLDFQLYNITGFVSLVVAYASRIDRRLFYTTYTIYKYVADSQAGAAPSVQPNDIAFGVHAVLLCLVTLYQFYAYENIGAKDASKVHMGLIAVLWLLLFYTLALTWTDSIAVYCAPVKNADCGSKITLIDYMGYAKAFISLVKYTPQAYFNYQRKSTQGWSIVNIVLDATGGLLSFLQQIIDAYNYKDSSIIFGNIPKLLLALESMGFDCLFLLQHYVFYRNATPIEVEGAAHQTGIMTLNTGSKSKGLDVNASSSSVNQAAPKAGMESPLLPENGVASEADYQSYVDGQDAPASAANRL